MAQITDPRPCTVHRVAAFGPCRKASADVSRTLRASLRWWAMVLHAEAQFRRATPLACYWLDGRLVAHNYATGRRAAAPPLALEILDFCQDWRTRDEVFAAFHSSPRGPLRRLLSLLVKQTLLERSVSAAAAADRRLATWRAWMPDKSSLSEFQILRHHVSTSSGGSTQSCAAWYAPIPSSPLARRGS